MAEQMLDQVNKEIKRLHSQPSIKFGYILGGNLVGEGSSVSQKQHIYPVPFSMQPAGDIQVVYLEFDTFVVIFPIYFFGDSTPIPA